MEPSWLLGVASRPNGRSLDVGEWYNQFEPIDIAFVSVEGNSRYSKAACVAMCLVLWFAIDAVYLYSFMVMACLTGRRFQSTDLIIVFSYLWG